VDTLTWQKIDTKAIPPGSYTFSCRAFSRCGDVFEKSMLVHILPLPQKPILLIQQKPIPCKGDSALIKIQNPHPGHRYFWNWGDTGSFVVVKQTGLYSLDSVSNAFGCGLKVGDTVAISIKNIPIPAVPVIAGPTLIEICVGAKAQFSIINSQLSIQYKWSNGMEGDSVSVGSGQFTVYSVSAEGCQSTSSDTIKVVEIQNPRPVFVNIDSILSRETLQNQNYCVAGQAGSTFRFTVFGGQKIDSSENCITINWTQLSIVNYQLSIKETLPNLPCSGTVSQGFSYRPNLKIPSLITPNGDGKNDVFEIEDLAFYGSHSLQIFDRWGKKMMETSAYKNDWGWQVGKHAMAEEGIYFYILAVDNKNLSGWLMVQK